MLTRALPCLSIIAALACTPAPERAGEDTPAKPQATATAPDPESAAEPAATANPYAEYGMPAPATAWTLEEYASASKAFGAIAKADASELPRSGSPTFDALANVAHLDQLAAGIGPERLVGLSLGLGAIHKLYGLRRDREPGYAREHLILTAAVLAVTNKLPGSVAPDEQTAKSLVQKRSQMTGLLRLRHGVHAFVAELLAFEATDELPYGFACEQLARVIDDTAPLLLPEEKAAARAKLGDCATGGADPAAIERLTAALAETAPSAPLVTALLAEHREFAAAEAG